MINQSSPLALALVIDNGPTSAWTGPDDQRIARIRQLSSWLISQVPPGSRLAVIDRSAVPAAFALDRAGALSKIETLAPRQVTVAIEDRIEAAIRLLRTSDIESRHVLVVSDLAASTWAAGTARESLQATLGAEPPVSITVHDLGPFSATNRRLGSLRISDATPPRQSSTPVVVSVQVQSASNSGAQPLTIAAELELFEYEPALPVVRNGQMKYPPLEQVDRTSLKVTSGVAGEMMLTVPPLGLGTHHGRIQLVGDDALALDDVRYFTLRVLPPAPILLVSDRAEESSIIASAMTAPFAVDDPAAEFAVENILYKDLPVVRLDDFVAILLLDPPVDELIDPNLTAFVREGGQLFVALGPEAEIASDDTQLLPSLKRIYRQPDPGTFIRLVRDQHPVLAALAQFDDRVRWSDYRVKMYWQVEPLERDSVLAEFAGTKHVALLERKLGEGRVLILTTPIPGRSVELRDWNDLFGSDAWPAFLLVRQVAEQLTHRRSFVAETKVGVPVIVPLPSLDPRSSDLFSRVAENEVAQEDEEVVVNERRPSRVQLYRPGEVTPTPLDRRGSSTEVTVANVARAGTYWVRGRSISTGFSANLDPAATDVTRIAPDQLDLFFGPDAYRLTEDRENIEFVTDGQATSVSLAGPAMLVVLIAFVLEQILSNRFYRSSNQSDVAPKASAA